MTINQTEARSRRDGPRLTTEQLQGRACVICGRESKGLVPAGHRTQDRLVWAVAACPEHRQAEQ